MGIQAVDVVHQRLLHAGLVVWIFLKNRGDIISQIFVPVANLSVRLLARRFEGCFHIRRKIGGQVDG